MLSSLDGGSVTAGSLPAGSHTFAVTFRDCLADRRALAGRRGAHLVRSHLVVWITVQPALADLGRRDDRMPRRRSVRAGVSIRRTVAAERDPTGLAGAQVHPPATDRHALFTFAALRRLHIRHVAQVCAGGLPGHARSSLLSSSPQRHARGGLRCSRAPRVSAHPSSSSRVLCAP